MALLYRWTDFPDFWIGIDLVRVGVDLRYIFLLLDLNQFYMRLYIDWKIQDCY